MSRLRAGQQAFNLLAATEPELAEQLRGSVYDPYYDDSRLAAFEEQVAKLRERAQKPG